MIGKTKKEICANGSTLGFYSLANTGCIVIRYINRQEESVYFYIQTENQKIPCKSKLYIQKNGQEFFKC